MAVVQRIALTASVLALALVGGCTNPRTEVIVSVDSDIVTLDSITLDVTDPRGTTRSSTAALGASEPALPRTLGLVWNGGELGPFVVRASGGSGGAQIVQRVHDFTFQRGRTLILNIDLNTRCVGVICSGGETCGDSGCRTTTIAPSELLPYTPGIISGGDGGVTSDGPCAAESCNGADDDCDGSIDEDFDFANDVDHCGSCGNACDFTNGMGMCNSGDCLITGCDTGFGDCNRRATDGCESDSTTDDNNCGRCGMRCRGGTMCCSGTCGFGC